MTTTTAADGAKPKILFAGLYLFTIAILLIIFTVLWKDTPVQPVVQNIQQVQPVKDDGTVQTMALLQARMQNLQDDYFNAAAGRNSERLTAAENTFKVTLDSVEKSIEAVKGEAPQAALKNLTAGLRTSFQKTAALIKSYASSAKDTVYASKTDDEAVQNLKNMLVEKEQKIAELQTGTQQQISAKDQTIATLQAQIKNSLAGKDKNMGALQTQMQTALAEKDKRYVALQTQSQAALSDRDKKLTALQAQLQATVTDRDKKLAGLQAAVADRDKKITVLQNSVQSSGTDKDKRIIALQNSLQTSGAEKDRRIASLQTSLQTSLADKDRTIAGLQNQVKALSAKQTVTVAPPKTVTDGSAEWRQKYAQLKSSYDNLSSKNNTLLNSYKSLAQDNRRLASQLQMRRATVRS